MLLLLLLFIEVSWAVLQGGALGVAAVIFALWLWKSGMPQYLQKTTNLLLEKRTVERDDALKEIAKLKEDIKSIKEDLEGINGENKALRREVTQRYEIHHEDQITIKGLKEEIWNLKKL